MTDTKNKADKTANDLIPNGGILTEKQGRRFMDTVIKCHKEGMLPPSDLDKAASELTIADFTGRYNGYLLAARVPPLPQRKYYGTPVYLFWKRVNGGLETLSSEFMFWQSTGTPSDRELADFNCTREQWNSNAKIQISDNPDDWDYAHGFISDCHYESELSYALACAFADMINNLK